MICTVQKLSPAWGEPGILGEQYSCKYEWAESEVGTDSLSLKKGMWHQGFSPCYRQRCKKASESHSPPENWLLTFPLRACYPALSSPRILQVMKPQPFLSGGKEAEKDSHHFTWSLQFISIVGFFSSCWIFIQLSLVSTIKMLYSVSNPQDGGIKVTLKRIMESPLPQWPNLTAWTAVKPVITPGDMFSGSHWQPARSHSKPWSGKSHLHILVPSGSCRLFI